MMNDIMRGVQDNLFIGGRLRPAHSAARILVINPATEEASQMSNFSRRACASSMLSVITRGRARRGRG
jgi:hypothetical protein